MTGLNGCLCCLYSLAAGADKQWMVARCKLAHSVIRLRIMYTQSQVGQRGVLLARSRAAPALHARAVPGPRTPCMVRILIERIERWMLVRILHVSCLPACPCHAFLASTVQPWIDAHPGTGGSG